MIAFLPRTAHSPNVGKHYENDNHHITNSTNSDNQIIRL